MSGNNHAELCPLYLFHVDDWVVYKGDVMIWRIQLERRHHLHQDRIRERGGAEIAEQLAVRVRSDTCTDNLPSDVVNQRYNAS